MKYIYPAIFTPEKGGAYSVIFPDLDDCYTSGESLADAMDMARDALCLDLYWRETEHRPIPRASAPTDISAGKKAFVNLVLCDTDFYRRYYASKAVKKTLTIPQWLNDEAVANNINFSQVLQDGLKRVLGITEPNA